MQGFYKYRCLIKLILSLIRSWDFKNNGKMVNKLQKIAYTFLYLISCSLEVKVKAFTDVRKKLPGYMYFVSEFVKYVESFVRVHCGDKTI